VTVRGAHKTYLAPLQPDDGRNMLRHLMNPETKPELNYPEENKVLAACGSRGVSPLALTIVCGVLRNEFADPLCDRSDYLSKLAVAIGAKDSEFHEVQSVMDISFGYLPDSLRRRFLELHLFPDQFTKEDAKALWPPTQGTDPTREMLQSLVRYNLLQLTTSEAGEHTFLMLDHIWVFATNRAEDPASEWLSRADFANALLRLLKLANTRWPPHSRTDICELPRLFHAARFHAGKLVQVKGGWGRPVQFEDEDEQVYRSLGSTLSAYAERVGDGDQAHEAFQPIEATHISRELLAEAHACQWQCGSGDCIPELYGEE